MEGEERKRERELSKGVMGDSERGDGRWGLKD